jgi:hypothetical protein
MDDGVSEEAHKSTVTKISKAEVSATIVLNESARPLQSFSIIYDRLQAEFQQRLVDAYTQMRAGYMNEF